MNKRVAIFNDTSTSRHYGCNAVMYNLVRNLHMHGSTPSFFWPVGKDWRPYASKIRKYQNFDAIIVNGEGSIHHSLTRPRAEYLTELAGFAKDELGIPAYLINASIYENEANIYSNISKFERVFVRESMTKQNLSDQGIDSKLVPDLSFDSDFNYASHSVYKKGILVTDSVDKYISTKLIDFACDNKQNYIALKRYSPLSRLDQIIKRASKGIFSVQYNSKLLQTADFDWFIKNINNHRFVVTGRFHTVAFSILTRTPFVAIASNTPKIEALLFDVFGSSSRWIRTDNLPDIVHSSSFDQVHVFDDEELKKVEIYILTAKEQIQRMASIISGRK